MSPARAWGAPDRIPLRAAREQPARRAHRLARYKEVVALHADALSCRAIATRVGVSKRTVQRWLQHGQFPERHRRSERPGQLAPYTTYLRGRWQAGCHNATQLWQDLRARGFTGSYTSVAIAVAPWRGEHSRYQGQAPTRRGRSLSTNATYTPRQVCWLLLRSRDALTDEEYAYLRRLHMVHP